MVTSHVSKQGSGRGKSDEKVSVVRAGSVTLKIYTLRHGDRVRYTVCWYVRPKRHTKNFQRFDRAEAYARERAEASAGTMQNILPFPALPQSRAWARAD
jgi:hypothetical protein